jgi:peptide/nickel transport system substrate-binding protein
LFPAGLPSFNNAKGYTYDIEKQKLVNEYKKVTVIKSCNPISTNVYAILESFAKRVAKNRLDVQVDISPPTLRQAISPKSFF